MPIPRYLLSDFVEIQRKSFFELLEKGLIEEFNKRNPIKNSKKNLEIFFYPEYYKLTLPENSPRNSILKAKSYTSKLYIPVQLTDKLSNIIKLKWVCIGNLPLMTKRGHFILNGAPRVIVNQILRSPGIYYQKKMYEKFRTKWDYKPEISYKRYYADLICQRGTWLRIEMDKEKCLWAHMKKGPKIPLFWLLIGMGLTQKIIFNTISEPSRLVANLEKQETLKEIKKVEEQMEEENFKKEEKLKKLKIYNCVKNPPDAWYELYSLVTANLNYTKNKFIINSKIKDNTNPPKLGFKGQEENPFGKMTISKRKKGNDVESSLAPSPLLPISAGLLPQKGKETRKERVTPLLGQLGQEPQTNLKTEALEPLAYSNSEFHYEKLNNKKKKESEIWIIKQKDNLQNYLKIFIRSNKQENIISKDDQLEDKLLLAQNNQMIQELGRKWLFNKFMNPRTYDLGKLGRLNFNRKLGISIAPYNCTLTSQDLLYATDYLIKVEQGLKKIDDIDHLKNRRVRTSGELLQIQIGTGLIRLEKEIREKLNTIDSLTDLPVRSKPYLQTKPSQLFGISFKISENPDSSENQLRWSSSELEISKGRSPSFARFPYRGGNSMAAPYQGCVSKKNPFPYGYTVKPLRGGSRATPFPYGHHRGGSYPVKGQSPMRQPGWKAATLGKAEYLSCYFRQPNLKANQFSFSQSPFRGFPSRTEKVGAIAPIRVKKAKALSRKESKEKVQSLKPYGISMIATFANLKTKPPISKIEKGFDNFPIPYGNGKWTFKLNPFTGQEPSRMGRHESFLSHREGEDWEESSLHTHTLSLRNEELLSQKVKKEQDQSVFSTTLTNIIPSLEIPLANQKQNQSKAQLHNQSSPKKDSNFTNLNKKSKFEKISKTKQLSVTQFINTKALNSSLREFFGSSPLSQFMDQINPLSELTHKRRLSSMGPGGVTRDSATLAIRGIHPTHYGRICPVETPEGKNTGLVNSMTAFARVTAQGFLQSPFYKVYKGQVQKKAGMFYFSADQEEKIKLAAADLSISPAGFLPHANIPVRVAEDFTKIQRTSVEYIGVSAIQMISIATSLIPFLEHDDANRALMGSNMQRQAVPLLRPERPIVGTGLEARAVSDSGHVLQAKYSGFVRYASGNKILIYSFN
jgi:DNA-directed RNA polymerase beta subunit